MTTTIRETWLEEMIDLLRPAFEKIGSPLPERIRVSCGFPSKSALARKAPRVGECWGVESSEDHLFQVFISPVLCEGVEVTATLLHELVHCAVGIDCKHRGPFPKVAKSLGLEGKMTATVASEALTIRLKELIAKLGDYPHARLVASNRPKTQSTRMILLKCPDCGYQVRTTKKWIEVGVPTCPCGTEMEVEGGEVGEDE